MKVFYTGLCVLLANNGNRISISIPAPDGFGWYYRYAPSKELLQLRASHLESRAGRTRLLTEILNATARNHT